MNGHKNNSILSDSVWSPSFLIMSKLQRKQLFITLHFGDDNVHVCFLIAHDFLSSFCDESVEMLLLWGDVMNDSARQYLLQIDYTSTGWKMAWYNQITYMYMYIYVYI